MDDFTWGHTRQVVSSGHHHSQKSFKEDYFIHKNDKGHHRHNNRQNPRSSIPQKRWTEWEMMHREKDREMMLKNIEEKRKSAPGVASNMQNNKDEVPINVARLSGSMLVMPPPRRTSLLR
jgi:hypothetical protein